MKQLFKYKFQLLIVVSSALVLVLSLISVFAEANDTKDLEMYYPAPKYKLEIQSASSRQIEVCEAVVRKTLDEFSPYIQSLENVVIHSDSNLRRGLANASNLYVRCLPDSEEFLNVLVHELGHVIDLGYLTGSKAGGDSKFDDFGEPIKLNDPSYEYYSISWTDNTTLGKRADSLDFASTYAMTDPFEDFAEAFMLYVRYPEIFLAAAEENPDLMKKYAFIKENIFEDTEFTSQNDVKLSSSVYNLQQNPVYDATRIHKKLLVNL